MLLPAVAAWGTRRLPRFPVRSSGQDHVCAFLLRKAHEVQETHETPQEIGVGGGDRAQRRVLIVAEQLLSLTRIQIREPLPAPGLPIG
jgi:hypothetical protein